MKNLLSSFLFAIFAFLSLSAESCGPTHLIDDSGFDIWCGELLCNWELQSGAVERAPSWHKDDYAVEFVGDDVVISQLSTNATPSCIRFELLADIEDNARVTLTMDFFDDGVIDYTQELGHVRWESLAYYVTTPTTWDGVRFTLHKEGPGRARVAQVEAKADSACFDKAIEITNKPLGGSCDNGVECQSQYCEATVSASFGRVCSGCSTSEDCQDGNVCGVSSNSRFFSSVARTCVAPASRPIGSLCVGDSECRLGACNDGVCSECTTEFDCELNMLCGRPSHPELPEHRRAAMCTGGAPGTFCTQDIDCSSGSCIGGEPVKVCLRDGRDCQSYEDCPGDTFSAEDATCVVAGIDPGTCQ